MTNVTPEHGADQIDPLDLQLDRLGAAPDRTAPARPLQTRLAISWATGSFPAVLLLLLGIAFGQHGLNLLTPGVLAAVDPAVAVALAALGIIVGLSVPLRRADEGRLLAAASIEALITGAIVGGGTFLAVPLFLDTTLLNAWVMALAIGICAATSSALPSSDVSGRTEAVRVRDLDAILPIVAGALLLAVARAGALDAGLLLAVQACGVALVIAAAGWLLLNGTTSDTEQRVFAISALLLVGGIADYLSLSALLSGLIAGAFWQRVGGAAREAVGRDVGYVQHPLAVVLLVVAGAQVEFAADAVAMGVAYVLLRTAAKLLGSWAARRVAGHAVPAAMRLRLTSPGIFGVAFAMNAVRALGVETAVLLTVVVVGTVGSQLVSAFDASPEVQR